MKQFIALASLLLGLGSANQAFAISFPATTNEPMSFQLIRLNNQDFNELGPESELTRGGHTSVIIANGQIVGQGQIAGVPATSATFKAFLQTQTIVPGTLMMMTSGGGNLFDSFIVGELIRGAGLRTSIVPNSICASACNFVFMGGTVRTMPADSAFVIHRFATGNSIKADEQGIAEIAQQQSGYIATYLKEMGIDSDFLVLMSRIENKKPQAAAASLLQQLKVLNSGANTTWNLNLYKGAFYLDAATSKLDNNGQNDHLSFFCSHGKIYLQAIYAPNAQDYIRPHGVAAQDPASVEVVSTGNSTDISSFVFGAYPSWDVEASSLVASTYALTFKNLSGTAIEIPKSLTYLAESENHQAAVASVKLNQEILDLILSSNTFSFGFLISSSGNTPASTILNSNAHTNSISRATVSFSTSISDDAKEQIQNFVQGCGG